MSKLLVVLSAVGCLLAPGPAGAQPVMARTDMAIVFGETLNKAVYVREMPAKWDAAHKVLMSRDGKLSPLRGKVSQAGPVTVQGCKSEPFARLVPTDRAVSNGLGDEDRAIVVLSTGKPPRIRWHRPVAERKAKPPRCMTFKAGFRLASFKSWSLASSRVGPGARAYVATFTPAGGSPKCDGAPVEGAILAGIFLPGTGCVALSTVEVTGYAGSGEPIFSCDESVLVDSFLGAIDIVADGVRAETLLLFDGTTGPDAGDSYLAVRVDPASKRAGKASESSPTFFDMRDLDCP